MAAVGAYFSPSVTIAICVTLLMIWIGVSMKV
jgi:hypothetical protein